MGLRCVDQFPQREEAARAPFEGRAQLVVAARHAADARSARLTPLSASASGVRPSGQSQSIRTRCAIHPAAA